VCEPRNSFAKRPQQYGIRVVSFRGDLLRDHRQRTMIIAMISMRMMQASVDQIINVIAVRNSLMTTVWSMLMS
jgi:hypothetical protein